MHFRTINKARCKTFGFNETNNLKRSCSAVQLTWSQKKENFSKLKLCQVIQSVIKNVHASVKDAQISNPLKIWLILAKECMDRETEKKRERNQKDQVRNNETKFESAESEESEERNE